MYIIYHEYFHVTVCFNYIPDLFQMFPSVSEDWMNVTWMQPVSTLLGVMTAFATLGSLEMDSHA